MEQIFNKLVRDNIPNIIESNNEVAVTKILNEEDFFCIPCYRNGIFYGYYGFCRRL